MFSVLEQPVLTIMTEVTTFVFWASPYFSFLVTEGHFKALCRPVLFGQILNIQTNLRQLKRTISGEIHKQRMAESEMEVYIQSLHLLAEG